MTGKLDFWKSKEKFTIEITSLETSSIYYYCEEIERRKNEKLKLYNPAMISHRFYKIRFIEDIS